MGKFDVNGQSYTNDGYNVQRSVGKAFNNSAWASIGSQQCCSARDCSVFTKLVNFLTGDGWRC